MTTQDNTLQSRYEIKVLKHQFIPWIDTELILTAVFRFVYAPSLKVRPATSLRSRGYEPLTSHKNCSLPYIKLLVR